MIFIFSFFSFLENIVQFYVSIFVNRPWEAFELLYSIHKNNINDLGKIFYTI